VTLLRYLSEPALREHVTAVTNRAESFRNYATWLMIGGRLIGHNDPDYQEKVVKFNELVANAAICSTALDITDAANALAAEGHPVNPDDLATITPYITRTIRRFGDWVLDLKPARAGPGSRAPSTASDAGPLRRARAGCHRGPSPRHRLRRPGADRRRPVGGPDVRASD
jgi:hypothetical protein